jgi:hypothetical protein
LEIQFPSPALLPNTKLSSDYLRFLKQLCIGHCANIFKAIFDELACFLNCFGDFADKFIGFRKINELSIDKCVLDAFMAQLNFRSSWGVPAQQGSFTFVCPLRSLYLSGTVNQIASPCKTIFSDDYLLA